MSLQSIELKFQGQKIGLKTEGDVELIQSVVDLVTAKLMLAEERAKNAPPHKIALLALLDLAEEYLKAKQRTTEHYEALQQKTSRIFELLQDNPSES